MNLPTYTLICNELPERRDAVKQHLRERGVDSVYWTGVEKTWGVW